MKSILAKQAPHRRPWLRMRVRQTMHTGESSRLASGAKIDRNDTVPGLTLAVARTCEMSAPPLDMRTMIGPGGPAPEDGGVP
jgi:hypothetical protein